MKTLITSVVAAALLMATPLLAADTESMKQDLGNAADKAGNSLEAAKNDLKTELFKLIDKDTAKVDFDKGSAKISDGERSDLKALVDSLQSDATVETYVVAAWSDKDYPAANGAKLPAADRKLADARKDAVVKALKALGAKKVEGHSMAEHPTWIAKVFTTSDATVKGAKEANADADQLSTEGVAKQIKDKGGAGTVVVIAKHAGIASH